jgi:heme-degrading monooxygenase HmoA
MKHYLVLWEFEARAEQQTEFERRYGPKGSWEMLFRRAPGYLETLLLKDRTQNLRYVTIDRWESVDAYRDFRALYSRQYEELDRLCEGLTTHEASLGEFSGG